MKVDNNGKLDLEIMMVEEARCGPLLRRRKGVVRTISGSRKQVSRGPFREIRSW